MSIRLGSYTTFDVPCVSGLSLEAQAQDSKCQELIVESKKWLSDKFEVIGGYVRLVYNPHDFGSYPSFEVDYPRELVDIITDLEEDEVSDYEQEWIDKKDKFHEEADKIYSEYNEKYKDFL